MNLGRDLAELRNIRGWTQEKLSEVSGLSVRTIRNLERSQVQNPRRTSVDLLIRALGVEEDRAPESSGMPDLSQWQGLQPPVTPMIGSRALHIELARTICANRLTTFVGTGGVGKTRHALNAAYESYYSFRDGVVVVELGDMEPERGSTSEQAAEVLDRVRRRIGLTPTLESLAVAAAENNVCGMNRLVILDNAEHVAGGVTAAARELLGALPFLHILITTRRQLTDRLGVNREIQPLGLHADGTVSPRLTPAGELVLQRLGKDSPVAAHVLRDLPALDELCERLSGIPRYLEFAAERLRTVPIRSLLATEQVLQTLRTNDHALLEHQRSLISSVRWSLDLLSCRHREMLADMVALDGRHVDLRGGVTQGDMLTTTGRAGAMTLVSDLLESSLILADAAEPYRFRLLPYVKDALEAI
ncbi:helix-turn-helix domain-containing protein [Streptomyces sp. NPDC057137]|uniref:helix-turn-helix domain-containing protein n=1 Tax=Streptomyces sp. NPDC057137 TaxID=3346030 RepID=UPI00363C6B47